MRSRSTAALGAALLVLGATASAGAQDYDDGRVLPPVAGTLRMAPEEFGGDQPRRYRHAYRQDLRARDSVQVVRGGLYPTTTRYQGLPAAERWATGGTGVSGLIGNTGNPYFGETGWGTADSATTGVGLAPRYGWRNRGLFTSGGEASFAGGYGEPPAYAGASYDYPAYGAAPQVPFYGSGTPYSMSYYSSGSAAGPYGSPGGLGVYRSGSYGYGPRVIHTGAYAHRGWSRQGCTCGPHIVHARRVHRHYSER